MRLLILGTGGMANHHAEHFGKIPGVTLAAAVDVVPGRAEAFARKHNVERAFTSLDAAIAWGDFDAATNVTPDALHLPTTMQLIFAGKHVLCEKPLAVDYAGAMQMTEAIEKAGLVGMVNLTYRNVAEIQTARKMVQEGLIGEVKHIEASYLQSWLSAPHWGDWRTEDQWLWRLSSAHGSKGVLGDVGIHILDFASWGAGVEASSVFCRLKTFHKAEGDKIGKYTLDANDSFVMTVEYDNGALGVVHASRYATGYANTLRLRVFGEKGGIEVEHTSNGSKLRSCIGEEAILKQVWTDVQAAPVKMNYEYFVEAVKAGKTLEPSFRHAANLQKILDAGFVTDGSRLETRL